MLRIATIVPTLYLTMTESENYRLALAHLLDDRAYAAWFRQSPNKNPDDQNFVIMDNGVVETGEPYDANQLFDAAMKIYPDEIVLPDWSRDAEKTFTESVRAAAYLSDRYKDSGLKVPRFMYVPHGETPEEWRDSVLRILDTGFTGTIGISRLLVPRVFNHRAVALNLVPELMQSRLHIHLLGCPNNPWEAYDIDQEFRHRIRGTDSGIAAIYTQAGMNMRNGQDKPHVELDFHGVLNKQLLAYNIEEWRGRLTGRYLKDSPRGIFTPQAGA